MTDRNVAPDVSVSLFDESGLELGRYGVVAHLSADLSPGETDSTTDTVPVSTDKEPAIVAVDDYMAVARRTREAATQQPTQPPVGDPWSNEVDPRLIQLLAVELVPCTLANGRPAQRIRSAWRNASRQPVGSVFASIEIFDDDGDLLLGSIEEYCIFSADTDAQRILPQQTYTTPQGEGYAVLFGRAARVRLRIVRADTVSLVTYDDQLRASSANGWTPPR